MGAPIAQTVEASNERILNFYGVRKVREGVDGKGVVVVHHSVVDFDIMATCLVNFVFDAV